MHLINRVPIGLLDGKTPISILLKIHNVFELIPRVFRCICYVHTLGPQVRKLDARYTKGIFLGYSLVQKGYKCFIHSSKK